MQEIQGQNRSLPLSIISDIRTDLSFRANDHEAPKSWTFDALSSEGQDAVIVQFSSPDGNDSVGGTASVSFLFLSGRQVKMRVRRRYPAASFIMHSGRSVSLEECGFRFDQVEYGSGYQVEIDVAIAGGRRLRADFEWLNVESQVLEEPVGDGDSVWNPCVPRADVSGRIEISNRSGKKADLYHFRGSGFHDSRIQTVIPSRDFTPFSIGRVHFSDSTAVFTNFGSTDDSGYLMIVRDGKTRVKNISYECQEYRRTVFGVRYASRIRLLSDDNIRLRVKPVKLIESSVSVQHLLCEMTLTLRDGIPRRSFGLMSNVGSPRFKSWLFRKLRRD